MLVDTERKRGHEHHKYEYYKEDSFDVVLHKTTDSHVTLWGSTDGRPLVRQLLHLLRSDHSKIVIGAIP